MQFVSVEGRVTLQFVFQNGVITAQGEHCAQSLLLKECEGLVCCYLVNPGIELALLSERGEVFPYFYQGCLQQIICILVGTGEFADVPVQALAVFFYKKIEGKLLFAFSPV